MAPLDQILYQGVIPGDAFNPVFRDIVGPAVPNVDDIGDIPFHQGAYQRRSHAPAIPFGPGVLKNPVVGRRQGICQPFRRCLMAMEHHLRKRLHCQSAGYISGSGAAHSVTD